MAVSFLYDRGGLVCRLHITEAALGPSLSVQGGLRCSLDPRSGLVAVSASWGPSRQLSLPSGLPGLAYPAALNATVCQLYDVAAAVASAASSMTVFSGGRFAAVCSVLHPWVMADVEAGAPPSSTADVAPPLAQHAVDPCYQVSRRGSAFATAASCCTNCLL